MTFYYSPKSNRKLDIYVNREKPLTISLMDGKEDNKISSITVHVKLKPGYNVIRMGSSYCWAPDIDCFYLKRLSSK